MKNIYFVDELHGSPRHGGGSTVTDDLNNVFKKKGYSSKILSLEDGLKIYIPRFVKLFPSVRELFIFPLLGRFSLKRQISEGSTIVFSSTTTPAFCNVRAKKILFAHCLFSRQLDIFNKNFGLRYKLLFNPVIRKLFFYLEKKSFDNVDKIIVTRHGLKAYLNEYFYIPLEKIEVIPQAVDSGLFNKSKLPANANHNKKTVLFVGRCSIAKGFEILIDVAKRIDARFLIITPRVNTAVVKIIKDIKNIELKVGVDHRNMNQYYQSSDIFMMPSFAETGPLVTIEAMACGLPIVGSTEGCGEFVKDKRNGFIVNTNSYEGYITPINTLLDDKHLRQEFSDESLMLSKAYSYEKVIKKILSTFES